LMELLVRKGYVEHPQILFGGVGDFIVDKCSLQIGQFESGLEMEDDLTKLVLEGGGGGSYEESYQNAMYFFARHTSIDCFEKRGKKGYLFLIGDEKPYPKSTRREIDTLFGDTVQYDISVEDLIAECRERYTVFFIVPQQGTYHGGDPVLRERWVALLGEQNVLMLKENDAVCETIATAIGMCEGSVDLDTAGLHLAEAGASVATIKGVTDAVAALAGSTALARVGTGDLPGGTSSVVRL
jgi:hypothetical protein